MTTTVSAIAQFIDTFKTKASALDLQQSDLSKAVKDICCSAPFADLLLALIEAPAFSAELGKEFAAANAVAGTSACRSLRSALNFSLGRFFGLLAELITSFDESGKQWQAFAADGKGVLLIDEIDKADIEFPNDLLQELDRMEFHVYETGETVKAVHRPIVIITSNNEKELPDAFLRRCFIHYIRFPDIDTMRQIVEVHHPGIKAALLTTALTQFYEIRETAGLRKKPSTSEVLDWLKLLLAEDLNAEDLKRDGANALPKLHGALLKNEQDVHLFERLAFMARSGR